MQPNFPQGSPTPANPFMVYKEDEIDLKVILFNYLQYWPILLACSFLGLISAFFINRYTTPVYSVESTVIIKDDKPTLGSDLFESAGLGGLQGKNNIENEIGILKSFSLAEETIGSLNLNVQYFEEGFFKFNQIYGNYPVFIKPNWNSEQIVGGLIKLEVIDESSFSISIEENEFQIFNPKDPYYKTKLENFELTQGIFQFGELVTGEFFDFTVDKVSVIPGEVVFFHFIDTPIQKSSGCGAFQ